MKRIIIVLIFYFLTPVSSFAEIYRCVDENGEVTFTTKPGPGCTLLPGSVEKKPETSKTLLAKIYRCVDEKGNITFTTNPGPDCTLLPGSVEKKPETSKTSSETSKTSMGNTQIGVTLFFLIIAILIIFYLISRGSKTKRVELKGIYGEKQKKYIRTFETKVVGVTFDNDDGSSRQDAIGNLQVGQQVYLVWNPHNPHSSNAILVFGNISTNEVVMSSCLGHLKSGLGADVLEWSKDDNYEGIYAEVVKILGGTKNKPTLGCLIRICLY